MTLKLWAGGIRSGSRASTHSIAAGIVVARKKALARRARRDRVAAGQFALAPENSITFAHFSVSSAMIFANSAGEPMIGGPPSSANRAWIAGSAKAVLISRLSLSTISGGVPLRAHKPFQELAS